jgi:hypothetical protein
VEAGFWPTSDIEPSAGCINGVEKFVATSTVSAQTWANTTVIDGDLSEFVGELKRQSGDDVGMHWSIALAQSLLEAAMVDELRPTSCWTSGSGAEAALSASGGWDRENHRICRARGRPTTRMGINVRRRDEAVATAIA